MKTEEMMEQYKKDLNKLKHLEVINYSIAILGIIIWIIVYLFNDYTGKFLANLLVVVFLLDMLAVYLAYIKPWKKKLINERHKEITEAIIKNNFPNCKYNYNSLDENNITPSEISSTGLISKGINGFYMFHHIKSVYKGVLFRFCTVKSYSTKNAYANTKTVDFKGCWFVFNCRIKVNSSLFVVSRNTETEEALDYKQKISALCRINTSNDRFNSVFSVFGYDNETPKYILTEDFMNNLIFLQKQLNTNLYLYFDNGMVHVGVERDKPFFAPMLNAFDSVERMLKSHDDDIKYIFTCLEMLDFSKYVSKGYTDFKIQNDSIYYTGKDVDTKYY